MERRGRSIQRKIAEINFLIAEVNIEVAKKIRQVPKVGVLNRE